MITRVYERKHSNLIKQEHKNYEEENQCLLSASKSCIDIVCCLVANGIR